MSTPCDINFSVEDYCITHSPNDGLSPTRISIEIRPTTLPDIHQINSIFAQTMPIVNRRRRLAGLARARGIFTVRKGSAIIAFYSACLKGGGTTLWIDFFGVRPSAQGRGVGRAMIQHCQELAVQAGAVEIGLKPMDNAATSFYTRVGFTPRSGGSSLYKSLPAIPDSPSPDIVRIFGRYRFNHISELCHILTASALFLGSETARTIAASLRRDSLPKA